MKYIYGPVKSRRLGFSLGVSLTTYKVCSFDCVYCQLGKTTNITKERAAYINVEEVLSEIKEYLKNVNASTERPAYISFSGYGEPTLNKDMAKLAQEIRKLTDIPLALITNASLFTDAALRRELYDFALVVPSLDAVTQDVFEAVDRPAPGISIEKIISGLAALRKEFKGKIYLEIMLIKDVNDSLNYAQKFKEAVLKICPDRIQLNTPVRSPRESGIEAPDKQRLLQIKSILGSKAEII